MFVLITYDVNITSPHGAKRLHNVARACIDYGKRVQNSVFECIVTEAQVTTQHPIKVTTQHPIKNFSLINYKLDFAYFHHHHEHSND